MAKNPKDGKLLYHLTALENLESIIDNGLKPRNLINFNIIDVADSEILESRKKFELGEHTPFHFFCPTPFAGSVQIANIKKEFVCIAITRNLAKDNNFTIIPTHPLNFMEQPLNWNDGMGKIDWDLMNKRDYSDHDCRETCMAESNFKGTVLAKHFNCIFVRNEEVKSHVVELLKSKDLTLNVNVNKHMFLKND